MVSDAIEEGISEGIGAREENCYLILFKTTFKHGWEEMFAMLAK